MPQISYRGNLTNGWLPFLASLQGQTVIVPRQDNNVTPQGLIMAGENAGDKDRGFPQIMYMHNCMPTHTGYKSIGFVNRIAGLSGNTSFQDCFILRDINENKFLYSPVSGQHYIWDGLNRFWKPASTQIISSSGIVTVAYINGNSYVFFQGIGMFQYDTNPVSLTYQTLIPVALTGITATALNGITSSNGFLIAWDNFTVYRSKPLSILDFTTDSSQGSGSSIPNDIKGQIVCCLPIKDGYVVYCTKNAVAASFQNNIQYPFIYKEIAGSGGITDPGQVSWTSNLGSHYAWTTNGLLQVNKLNAIQVHPEVSDFLTALQYEFYDIVANTLNLTNLTSPLITKLSVVADRYLVLSYGISTLTDALVLDIAYKRWGKIHIDHVASFEFYQPNAYGDISWNGLGNISWTGLGNTAWQDLATGIKTIDLPQTTLAFLQNDGTIYTIEFDAVGTNETGVLILGRYQYLRSNFLVLDEVDLQNAKLGQLTIVDLPSYDGMNFSTAIPLFPDPNNTGTHLHYYADVEALNHSLCLQGTFTLADIILSFHVAGHA
jgi:hypothetical protein